MPFGCFLGACEFGPPWNCRACEVLMRSFSNFSGFQKKTDPHQVWLEEIYRSNSVFVLLTFGPVLWVDSKINKKRLEKPPQTQWGRWCLSTWQSFVSGLRIAQAKSDERVFFSGLPLHCRMLEMGKGEWGTCFVQNSRHLWPDHANLNLNFGWSF